MKLIRLPEVEARVGLKHSAIYGLIKVKQFPAPIKQGSASFWMDTEIDAYLAQCAADRPADRWRSEDVQTSL